MLRWLKRIVLVLVALVVLLACAGSLYQLIGSWRDHARYPQRGKSIQAGPLKLNLDCSGKARPTVILESGSSVPAIGWIKVQPEVAKFARVCSYDRAGYGWSDPGPEPRTSRQSAKELKALLTAAHEEGPYILVGHSLGGFNVRVFTGQYPADVAGLVLVDASPEDYDAQITSKLPPEVRKEQEKEEKTQRILTPYLNYLGVIRLAARLSPPPPGLSQEVAEELNFLSWQPKAVAAAMSEMAHISESEAQVRASGNLGDRPLIVLTAGKPGDDDASQHDIWVHVLQPVLAKLSTRGKQILVEDSTHMIPFERPDAIIQAIREVRAALGPTGSQK